MVEITATMPMNEYQKLKTNAEKYNKRYVDARTTIVDFLDNSKRRDLIKKDFLFKGRSSIPNDSINPFEMIVEYAESLEPTP